MKLLLYCTKSGLILKQEFFAKYFLNGKIVAECDFEVEEISVTYADYYHEELAYNTNTLSFDELLEKSCLDNQQLDNYLYGDNGYAIHIKNLHIFNEPKELSDYYHNASKLEKAPQNMMMVQELTESDLWKGAYLVRDYVLISIRPEWLCKILNGEKTIEVRRKVLKEMVK